MRFVELFNAERFWESHEVLEEPWRANRSEFYRGLIQLASVFVHAQRGNPRGICKQAAKALPKLESYPAAYMGINVGELVHSGRQWGQLAAASGKVPALTFPRIRLDPAGLRGDEPELQVPPLTGI